MTNVCVYCGASSGNDPTYAAAAREFGALVARGGGRIIYGGGKVGLMGALADGALDAGGEVIGVIPQSLFEKEVGHGGVTQLHVVASMHERKTLMADLGDAFVALPGGVGTLEEFFEIWTWGQLGLHAKPFGLLNVAGFFDPLLRFLDQLVTQGFVRAEHREFVSVDSDAQRLLAQIATRRPPPQPRWVERDTT